MNMWQTLIDFFRRLFPRAKPQTTDTEQRENAYFASQYSDTTNINFTSIVANKVANIAVSDVEISVFGENERAQLLDASLRPVIDKLRSIVQRVLGVGGVVIKPYMHNGKLYADVVSQHRYFVVERRGEVITRAGFIAEVFEREGRIYTRTEYHSLEPTGVYTIENKASIDYMEVPLSAVPEWADRVPSVSITGVNRMLFAPVLSPIDNRRGEVITAYGVPITFGQDKLVGDIVDLLNDMQREFKDKRSFIGVSDLLFNAGNKLPTDGIFKKFQTNEEGFFEEFSPVIREQSYIKGLDYLFGLLERAIGVNKGVLTELDTRDATATAIKRSTIDTFSLVSSIWRSLERALDDLLYAFDVLANAAQLTPPGEYEASYDWSYVLIEDSRETFDQLLQAQGAGAIGPEHLAAYVLGVPVEEALEQLPETERLIRP